MDNYGYDLPFDKIIADQNKDNDDKFVADKAEDTISCPTGSPVNAADGTCCTNKATYNVDTQHNGICCPYGTTFHDGGAKNPGICCDTDVDFNSVDGTCCEYKATFNKDSKGKGFCCPFGSDFGVQNDGTGVCCPPDTDFNTVTKTCCSCANVFHKDPNGKGFCCPSFYKWHVDHNKNGHCCEMEGSYNIDNKGNGVCCPYGATYNPVRGDCCDKGSTLYSAGTCCSSGATYDSVFDACCPAGSTLHAAGVCCAEGSDYNSYAGSCCGTGYYFDKSSKRCIPIPISSTPKAKVPPKKQPPPPPTTPKPPVKFAAGTFICCPDLFISYSGDGVGQTDVCCPPNTGFNSVDWKCCSYKATYAEYKDANGKSKGLCCPFGSTLEKGLNGASVCCPPNAVFNSDTGECCPYGSKMTPDKNGKKVCCRAGDTLTTDSNGKNICCPKTYTIHNISNGKKACCAPDETFGTNPETGLGYCCPTDAPLNTTTGKCCPTGSTVHIADSTAVCCPAGVYFATLTNTCCQPGDSIYHSSDGNTSGKTFCCASGDKAYQDDPRCCRHDPSGKSCGGENGLCCPFGLAHNFDTCSCCEIGDKLVTASINGTCCPVLDPLVPNNNVKTACCPDGSTSNSYNETGANAGLGSCCPPGTFYNSSTKTCCDVGQTISADGKSCINPQINPDGCYQVESGEIQCCAVGQIAYTTSQKTYCCGIDEVFYYTDALGNGQCLPKGTPPAPVTESGCNQIDGTWYPSGTSLMTGVDPLNSICCLKGHGYFKDFIGAGFCCPPGKTGNKDGKCVKTIQGILSA